jgi:hypothetical protein
MLHHRRREDELSGCPLDEILNSVLGWPIGGYVGAKWMKLLDLLESRPEKPPYFSVGHKGLVEDDRIDLLAQVVQVEGVADRLGTASDEYEEGQFAVNKHC